MFWDDADEIHVSVTFTWDIPRAEKLARMWEPVAPVKVGGPAYNDFGGQFVSGMYLKDGYTISHRGCKNTCWFCDAWRREGREIRQYEIVQGYNLLDNNILACDPDHQLKVFKMLERQKRRPMFSGGLEALRLSWWHVEWLKALKPEGIYFAYDTPGDYEPLVRASKMLRQAELLRPNMKHWICCYVLIGWEGDTFEKAEKRLQETVKLGFFPQAMLYNRRPDKEWRRFQREWANKTIVGSKLKEMLNENNANRKYAIQG
jgi:hypothetical protein